jgi:periplasmic divalent cation tolerance protein
MSSSSTNYGIVLVTASSEAEANSIAEALVHSKLAACVSVMPIRSLYTWKDKLYNEAEWQLVVKTDLNSFAQIEAKIRSMHSYEVPEIIALPIVQGSPPYLQWVTEQLQRTAT